MTTVVIPEPSITALSTDTAERERGRLSTFANIENKHDVCLV